MKYSSLFIFLLTFNTSCELFSGADENENKRVDFNIDSGILESELTDVLEETSGLIWFDNKLWSLNDGGNENKIYAFDSNGEIIKTVELAGKVNEDWEALAQDDDFVYIGDFGNNEGDRTDLKVLKVSKEILQTDGTNLQATAEEIKFSYSNQSDFSKRLYQHEFDCEAMIAVENELIIFSKNWVAGKTKAYKLPKQAGEYELNSADSYDVNGLVTGADLSSDGKYLALIGYSNPFFGLENLNPFIFLFNFHSEEILGEKVVFLNLTSLLGNQTEGIAFTGENTLSFSSEKTNANSQKLFEINWSDYKKYLE